MNTKTHIVLDTFYSLEEGQETFVGSLKECQDFVNKQSDPLEQSLQFYKIRELTKKEIIYYNDPMFNPN